MDMVELQTWQLIAIVALSIFAGWSLALPFWLFVLGLCNAAGDADDEAERLLSQYTDADRFAEYMQTIAAKCKEEYQQGLEAGE